MKARNNPITFTSTVLASAMVALVLVLAASCASKSKAPAPVLANAGTHTLEAYIENFKDNPEMYPRELSMTEREELLTVNWAMKKAMKEGKQSVRLLAPPLQLTGDENIDRTSTYYGVICIDYTVAKC